MKYSEEELNSALADLKNNQNLGGIILGSIIGAVPAGTLFYNFASMGGTLAWLLFVPAAIIGWFAKFTGNSYELKYRAIPAALAFSLHVIALLFIFKINPIFLALAPISGFVALYFSKVSLTKAQEAALWRIKNLTKS